MTARYLASLALALGLALTGCSGDPATKDAGTTDSPPGDDDDDDDDDDTDVTGITVGDEYFQPDVILLRGGFGWDLQSGTFATVTGPYGTYDPYLSLVVGNSDFSASYNYYDYESWCLIYIYFSDPTFASWAQDANQWYGFEYTGDGYDSNCTTKDGFEFDPAFLYGAPDFPTLAVSGVPWGLSVGDMSADAASVIAGYGYTYLPEGSLFGGAVQDGLIGDTIDSVIAYAEAVDGTFTLTGDVLSASSVQVGTDITTAYYNVVPLYTIVFN